MGSDSVNAVRPGLLERIFGRKRTPEEARDMIAERYPSTPEGIAGNIAEGARMVGRAPAAAANAMVNFATGLYGNIRDAESDPRPPSEMRKDEIAERVAIAPQVMLPASLPRALIGQRVAELAALGGKGFGPEKTSLTEWAKTLRDEGYTNAEIARTLTRHYSKPGVEITPRDVAESLGVEKGAAVENAMPGYGGRREGSGRPPNPLKAPAMDELAVRDLPILGVDPRFRELQQALADKFPGTPTATINNWIMEYQGKGKWAGQGSLKEGTIKTGPASIEPPQAARAEAGDDVLRGPVINPDQGEFELGAMGAKGRGKWTPDMVATLQKLNETHGRDRNSVIQGFRDAFPEYQGTDGTIGAQASRVRMYGANAATGAPSALEVAGESARHGWTPEMVDKLKELSYVHGRDRASVVRGFRQAFPTYGGEDATILGQASRARNNGGVSLETGAARTVEPTVSQQPYDELAKAVKDALDGGEFELGAMGGRGPGGRITQEDVEDIAAKLGTSVRWTRQDPKRGTIYAAIPSAENPDNQIWDTVVRLPTDNKSHPGRRIPGSNQYVIDTTDAPKNFDPKIATNMSGGRYSDKDNLEAALRARNGEPVPDELRPTPQQLPLRGSSMFPKTGKAETRQREAIPAEEPDPNQLKLLASGAPIPPFETTVEQEPGTSTFAKSPDIRQSQDELLASSTRHLADKAQALNNEADDLTSYPRLRFGLPPGFVLDKSNAMEP